MFQRVKVKTRPLLGIDIGTTSVKMIALSNWNKQPCIEGYAFSCLSCDDSEPNLRDIDAIALCIKKLLIEINLSAKRAIIAVPDCSVIAKKIQVVNDLTDLELEEFVFLEASKYLGQPENEISLDYTILGAHKKFTGMNDVLFNASKKEQVMRRVKAVKQAGLTVSIVDIESYAISRVISHFTAVDQVVVVIDIGYQFLRLYFFHANRVIHTQQDEFGIKELLLAITRHYKITATEARRLHAQQDKPKEFDTAILLPFYSLMLIHLKRQLQFFFATYSYDFIDKIFLAGELEGLVNLAQYIKNETHYETCVVNPFSSTTLSKNVDNKKLNRVAPAFLLAFGLAMRLSNGH